MSPRRMRASFQARRTVGCRACQAVGMSSTETSQGARAGAVLPAALRLGPVHLTVADVDRAVAWYQRSLGLRVHRHAPAEPELGDGAETVLVLHEDAQAGPAGRHAG